MFLFCRFPGEGPALKCALRTEFKFHLSIVLSFSTIRIKVDSRRNIGPGLEILFSQLVGNSLIFFSQEIIPGKGTVVEYLSLWRYPVIGALCAGKGYRQQTRSK